MEIKDYLKVLGKRAWLLIMIPAVAGVVAGLIAVQQPQAFRTTATLQLPHDVTSSPAEVAQLVADFKAAANNPTVQSKVSKDTGLTLQQIRHMNITQVGDSSQLTLGYQTKAKSPTAAKAVILGISSGALDYLAAPESSATQQAHRRRQRQDQGRPGQPSTRRTPTSTRSTRGADQHARGRPEDDEDPGVELLPAAGGGGRGRGDGEGAGVYQDAIDQADLQIVALQTVLPQVQALQAQIADAQKAISDGTDRAGRRGRQARRDQRHP